MSSRDIKISPQLKEGYRKDFINKCLQRVKRDRETNFEKLRGHGEDCGSYAREIVSNAMDSCPPVLGRGEFNTEQCMDAHIAPLGCSDEGGSMDPDMDADFYVQVMEQVALELELEYAEYAEQQQLMLQQQEYLEFSADDMDEAELLSSDFLLCPFCRLSNMEMLGSRFSCSSCGDEFYNFNGMKITEIREKFEATVLRFVFKCYVLCEYYVVLIVTCVYCFCRHRSCCIQEENRSPDLLMIFKWNGENLFASCDCCLFYEHIL
jgi:hypothetical protein